MLEIFLFYFEMNIAGNIFTIVAFVLFLINLFGGDNNGISVNEIMNYVDVGFLVMCVGLITMSVSSLFGTVKRDSDLDENNKDEKTALRIGNAGFFAWVWNYDECGEFGFDQL